MGKNIGEYDELRIKLRLIELRDSKSTIKIGNHTIKIKSVGLEKEFLPLPSGTDLRKMTDLQIEKLANKVGAGKAKTSYKADVNINGKGYSIKSHSSAPPAIVNHTPRWGWSRICEKLGVSITPLDNMVEEYFDLRLKRIITEDVNNSNTNSPFAKNKEYLRPILNYFIFKGTGAKDSEFPADYVLVFTDPYDTNTWELYSEDKYIDMFWDDMIFSMRNKGFEAYPYLRTCDLWKNDVSEPWAKRFDGTLKGSLHIRVS